MFLSKRLRAGTSLFLHIPRSITFADITPEHVPPTFTREYLERLHLYFEKIPIRHLNLPLARTAAVFVPLCNINNEASLLFTKRSQTMRKHSGEVSFPGGVHERGDKDLIDTALRETKEELGLVNDQSLNNKLLPISRYHEILSSSHIVVTPVIGYIHEIDLDMMKPNEEVEKVFTLTLRELLDPTKRTTREVFNPAKPVHSSRIHVPVFTAGEWPIWGLTSYIVEQFLKEIAKARL